MKTKCLILKHPLTIPRVARLLDGIVETGEFDIVEVIRHLLNAIGEHITDNDPDHPFDPLIHYHQLISDEIDALHMAVDEDYDPDDDATYSAVADSIAVAMDMAHNVYYETILPSLDRYSFGREMVHKYTVRSYLNEPIEEALDDDYVMIQIKSVRKLWKWERNGRGAKIFTPSGQELWIT